MYDNAVSYRNGVRLIVSVLNNLADMEDEAGVPGQFYVQQWGPRVSIGHHFIPSGQVRRSS